MRGKSWLVAAAIIGLLTVVPSSQALDKVKFATSWILYGADSAFFAAREKGLYQKAGLDVEILRGWGSGNTIKAVSTRSVHFGVADMASLVTSRTQGAQAREIAMLYGKAPHSVIFLKRAGIRAPKDLEGRTIADVKGSSIELTFGAFAGLAGFDAAKVKWLFMDVASRFPTVLAGKADAMPLYLTEWPSMEKKSRELNQELGIFLWADYGFNVYSNGLIAHDEDIANKPDLVRRYLKATMEGWAFGVDHPEEAAQQFLRFHPEHSADLATAQWKVAASLSESPEAKKHGIGHMLEEKVKATRDIMFKAMNLKGEVKTDDLYTNQFNPRILPKAWQ